jgi:hypothetical protein
MRGGYDDTLEVRVRRKALWRKRSSLEKLLLATLKEKSPANWRGFFLRYMEISCLLAGVSRYRIMNTDYDGAKPLR